VKLSSPVLTAVAILVGLILGAPSAGASVGQQAPDALGLRATSLTLFGVPAGVTRTFAVRALGLPGVVATASATPTGAEPPAPEAPVTGRRPAAGTPMAPAPAAPRVRTRRGHVALALPPAGRGSRLVVFRAPRTGMYRRLASTRRRVFVDRDVTAGRVVRYRLVRVSARGFASAASRAITVRVRHR
jgi:hypothetical protein